MRRGFAAVLVVALAGIALAGGKNLQFYRKDISNEELRQEMNVLKKSLGVSCEHCHQYKPKRDFSVETDMKKDGRRMLVMQAKIQKDCFTKDFLGVKDEAPPTASCFMCHKGKEKPEYKPEKPEQEAKFNEAIKDPKYKDWVAGMEKLVAALNKDHFTWKNAPKATCWMCHRGSVEFSTKLPDSDE